MARNPNPIQEPAPAIIQGLRPPADIRNPLPVSTVRSMASAYIDTNFIDEFSQTNWFFGSCPWIRLTDPYGNGSTITYKFTRLPRPPKAVAREYNANPDETHVEFEHVSVECKMIASAFAIDKDLAMMGGMMNQLETQWNLLKRGINDTFNEMVIRGNSHVPKVKGDECLGYNAFDGFEVFASQTYHRWTDPLDLSVVSSAAAQPGIWDGADITLTSKLRRIIPRPTYILGNNESASALSSLAHKMGTWTRVDGEWEQEIDTINGVSLVPMGKRAASNRQVIDTTIVDVSDDNAYPQKPCVAMNDAGDIGKYNRNEGFVWAGITKLYCSSFGDEAIVGIAPAEDMFQMNPPDLTGPNFVKKGDMELKCGLAMKSRNCLGVFDTVYLPPEILEYRAPGIVGVDN